MKGRIAWLVAGVVITVTVLASGSFSLWYLTAFKPSVNSQIQTVSYTGQPRSIAIQLDSGDITLRPGPAGQIRVTRAMGWTGAKPVVDEHWDGQKLRIQQHCPQQVFTRVCRVFYRISVPPGVTIDATTDSGTITATGLAGVLNLTSLAGDVDVSGARSPEVLASTDAGDIVIGFDAAPDFVKALTYQGDVTVKVPPGASYNVQPVADAGSVRVSVTTDQSARRFISATSDSGDVSVVYK